MQSLRGFVSGLLAAGLLTITAVAAADIPPEGGASPAGGTGGATSATTGGAGGGSTSATTGGAGGASTQGTGGSGGSGGSDEGGCAVSAAGSSASAMPLAALAVLGLSIAMRRRRAG